MTDTKTPTARPAVFVDRQSAPTIGGHVLTFGDQFDMPADYAHLDVLDSPEAQVERWGRVRFVPGDLAEHPEVVTTLEADAAAAEAEALRARQRAYAAHGKTYLSPAQLAALETAGQSILNRGGARA